MDISDQHLQQAVAASSHGPVSHALLPLNYMHNLPSVDNHSPLIPSYTLVQPPLIISSSSLGEHKAALNHFSASYRAAAPISSSGLGNMSINPNNSGSDQYIPGKPETFDYGFNQIYDDQLQFFEMPVNNPHERAHSTGRSKDTQKLMPHETAKTPTELNSAAGAFSSQAGQTSGGDVLKSEPDEDSFAPISTHRSSVSGYPFASNGSFLHSLVDMESLKEEAYSNDARGGADFEHEPRMPSTSTPADYHCHHLLDFSNLTSFPAQEMTDSHRSHKGTALNTIHEKRPTSSNPLVPSSKVAAGTESGVTIGIAHARGKAQTPPKRRKSQQKRVVCVPAMGGVERPTGECVPSDSWAWRKYGQKPIKNSPYPRSYYKCSSVKGCTARKQVERNPSDPMMIIITYTVEHSHPASSSPKPALDVESEGNDKQIETDDTQIDINDVAHTSNILVGVQDGADAMSEESGEPISSEGNLNDISNEEVMISESDYQKVEQQQQDSTIIGVEEHVGSSCSSSLYPFGNLKSRSSKADDDFFAQLGELPDLFGKNSVWPGAQCDHHNQSSTAVTASSSAAHDTGSIPLSTHINIDPFDLYYWP